MHFWPSTITKRQFTAWGNESESKIAVVGPYDPKHFHWHTHHKSHFGSNGQKTPEDHQMWNSIIEAIRSFDGVVLASHGVGAANEGMLFERYMTSNHKDLSGLIVARIENDNHKTENQLLAEASMVVGAHHNKHHA